MILFVEETDIFLMLRIACHGYVQLESGGFASMTDYRFLLKAASLNDQICHWFMDKRSLLTCVTKFSPCNFVLSLMMPVYAWYSAISVFWN